MRMSESQKNINRLGEKNPMFGKKRAEGAGKLQRVSVLTVVNNETSEYVSIKAAGLDLGIRPTVISRFITNDP